MGRFDFSSPSAGFSWSSDLAISGPKSRRLPLEDAFRSFLPDLSIEHLSWVFQRSPLHRHQLRRPLLRRPVAWVDRETDFTLGSSLRPALARGLVLFHLHGFSPS
jgi:hypothetical protein